MFLLQNIHRNQTDDQRKNRDCCKPICFRRKRHSNTIDVHTIQSRDHRWQFQNDRDRCQEFHNLIQVIINDRSKQRHRTSQDIMINIRHLHCLFILNDNIFQQFFIFFVMSKPICFLNFSNTTSFDFNAVVK